MTAGCCGVPNRSALSCVLSGVTIIQDCFAIACTATPLFVLLVSELETCKLDNPVQAPTQRALAMVTVDWRIALRRFNFLPQRTKSCASIELFVAAGKRIKDNSDFWTGFEFTVHYRRAF